MPNPRKAFEFATPVSRMETRQSTMVQMPNICENIFGLTNIHMIVSSVSKWVGNWHFSCIAGVCEGGVKWYIILVGEQLDKM